MAAGLWYPVDAVDVHVVLQVGFALLSGLP